MLEKTYIPYGGYWSSPFCRWQGQFANANACELVAQTAKRFLDDRGIEATNFDGLTLGMTVPQKHSFYGAPWVAAMLGADGITGPMIGQACATSARVVASAAGELETGSRECVLGLTTDRTSNGPHLLYPNPAAPGGRGDSEDWVWDNFSKDPYAGGAMISTAENVAQLAGFSREEQDEITLIRHGQYEDALADDRAFQKRYLFPVELGRGRKTRLVEEDEGVFPTTAEGLAKLRPMLDGGTVTFGSQTYPADGNAGMILASRDRAAELSRDGGPLTQIVSFGQARVEKAHMPMAVVPAAMQALKRAGIALSDLGAIKTHNPFAVNDLFFCKETGVAPEAMNRYGSPLIFGHPQGPTGMRVLVELIEELAIAGGGWGLFSGCAAGDTAMAVVLKVG